MMHNSAQQGRVNSVLCSSHRWNNVYLKVSLCIFSLCLIFFSFIIVGENQGTSREAGPTVSMPGLLFCLLLNSHFPGSHLRVSPQPHLCAAVSESPSLLSLHPQVLGEKFP